MVARPAPAARRAYHHRMPRARARSRPLPFALRIAVTNAWVSQLFDQELAKRGVAPFQAGILMMVRQLEPVTPTVLEAAVGIPGATLRDRIRELSAAGLVERVPNADDGRSYFLRTTAGAAETLRATAAAAKRVSRLVEDKVGPLDELSAMLDDVREVARTHLEGDLAPWPGSRSTGPW
jgi:DNA-binding MarR family transcriptional regulator